MRAETISYPLIDPDPEQPRLSMDSAELQQLAASIRDLGQLQSVIVYCQGERYTLVDGHRRHAALGLLRAETINALVLERPPDADTLLQTQLAANCLRVDLKPTEKALAYQRLLQSRNWSHVELAQAMHVSKSTVTQTLSWLSLSDAAKAKLDAGELSGSAAYAISRAGDGATQQALLDKAVSSRLTRDDVQREVSRNGTASRRQRSIFRLVDGEVSLQIRESSDLDGCVELLQQLLRECRKAIKQGLDVSTFERVLTDRLRAGA